MKNQHCYVPPAYIPLGQSDLEAVNDSPVPLQCSERQQQPPSSNGSNQMQAQWSSGICACCDDMQSFNTACCFLTDGMFLGLPGCLVSCYACGYRRTLRSKYNLPEAPCGDFVTHFCCHLCANCQEYREIRERAGDNQDMKLAVVTAPPVQTMQPNSEL